MEHEGLCRFEPCLEINSRRTHLASICEGVFELRWFSYTDRVLHERPQTVLLMQPKQASQTDSPLALFLVGIGHPTIWDRGRWTVLFETLQALNLRQDWDYPALCAMLANFIIHRVALAAQVDVARVSIWGVSCGGQAVWDAALNDGQYYNGMAVVSSPLSELHCPGKYLRSAALTSLEATAVVSLHIRESYDAKSSEELWSNWFHRSLQERDPTLPAASPSCQWTLHIQGLKAKHVFMTSDGQTVKMSDECPCSARTPKHPVTT